MTPSHRQPRQSSPKRDDRGPLRTIESLPTERLRQLQLQRLHHLLRRVGRSTGDIGSESLEDVLSVQPFTTKTDLYDSYPLGMVTVPREALVRIHASSGSRGVPTLAAYTAADVQVWTDAMARTLWACGVGSSDVVQVALSYGPFTGGLGFHYGAEALGATVVPTTTGHTDRQARLASDLQVTVVCSTPSFFIHLLERAREVLDAPLTLRTAIFGAEPWSDAIRARVHAECGAAVHDTYGLSEIIGPGVAVECAAHDGLHVLEDHFYPEVIDPSLGTPLPPGVRGELVLTTLTKEAMPLIRYRTGDMTALLDGPCPCGRTLRRIGRVSGRTDDMITVRGVNTFPSQIEEVVLAEPWASPHYQIVVYRSGALDVLQVRVESNAPDASDVEGLRERLSRSLGFRVEVEVHTPGSLPRSQGKAQRLLDLRK